MLKCVFVTQQWLRMQEQYHQDLSRGMSDITADSQTSSFSGMLGKNAMIIHSGLRKEITSPCLAMHQGGGICEKQQENIICV